MRRAYVERAVFVAANFDTRDRLPRIGPILTTPRNAAGFRAAVNLERRRAVRCGVLLRGVARKRSA